MINSSVFNFINNGLLKGDDIVSSKKDDLEEQGLNRSSRMNDIREARQLSPSHQSDSEQRIIQPFPDRELFQNDLLLETKPLLDKLSIDNNDIKEPLDISLAHPEEGFFEAGKEYSLSDLIEVSGADKDTYITIYQEMTQDGNVLSLNGDAMNVAHFTINYANLQDVQLRVTDQASEKDYLNIVVVNNDSQANVEMRVAPDVMPTDDNEDVQEPLDISLVHPEEGFFEAGQEYNLSDLIEISGADKDTYITIYQEMTQDGNVLSLNGDAMNVPHFTINYADLQDVQLRVTDQASEKDYLNIVVVNNDSRANVEMRVAPDVMPNDDNILYGSDGADEFVLSDDGQADFIVDFKYWEGDVLDIRNVLEKTGFDKEQDAINDYLHLSWNDNQEVEVAIGDSNHTEVVAVFASNTDIGTNVDFMLQHESLVF